MAANPAALLKGSGDTMIRTKVHPGTNGLQYVAYERTYRGLPVVGGDAVVVTNSAGTVLNTSVAQSSVINVATTATVGADAALATAKAQLATVESTSAPRLVVLAWGSPTPGLGDRRHRDQRRTRRACCTSSSTPLTGAVTDSYDEVRAGTGNGFYYGNVTISTSGSGSSFSMQDPTRPGIRCGGQTGTTFTGTDDVWGNGSGTNLETACVDALYGGAEGMGHARQLAGPQRHQRQRRRLPDPGRPQPGQRVLERQLHQLRAQLGQHPARPSRSTWWRTSSATPSSRPRPAAPAPATRTAASTRRPATSSAR